MMNQREAMPLLVYQQAGKGFCRSLPMLLAYFQLPDPNADRPLAHRDLCRNEARSRFGSRFG
ncbi:MAG: hypothetical protein ACOX1A_05300 [Saccharofermentanales bacterium]